jgi:hypothetical protein
MDTDNDWDLNIADNFIGKVQNGPTFAPSNNENRQPSFDDLIAHIRQRRDRDRDGNG